MNGCTSTDRYENATLEAVIGRVGGRERWGRERERERGGMRQDREGTVSIQFPYRF